MPAARPAGMTSASAPRFDPKGLRKQGNGSSPPPEAFFRMRGSVMSQRGNETVAANRRGATCDARCPAGAQRPRRTRTASIVVPATVRACVGYPGVINGAPTAAGRPAAMKHGDETAAANRRGATRDARCPYGHNVPAAPASRQSPCPQPCVHASVIRAS